MNIKAEIVADSINEKGNRITTFLLTYPRIIHAELLTHRAFSRNAASSRAIPFKRMCEAVLENPFVPIAWQRDHSGMQGTEYLTDEQDIKDALYIWMKARSYAVQQASELNHEVSCVTKQIANRLLEPFQWYTSLVTATDFENFFELRCPQYQIGESPVFRSKVDVKDYFSDDLDYLEVLNVSSDLDWLKINKGAAEIHLMALAECMWDAMNENTPEKLQVGEWHIPFKGKINTRNLYEKQKTIGDNWSDLMIKTSTGMSARTSYTVVGDEKEVKYETLIGIHDKMINQRPFHASPFEHCAQANDGRRSRNFVGFTQYREIIENGK